MKSLATLFLFAALAAAGLLFTGLVLKAYWTVFMIGWGLI